MDEARRRAYLGAMQVDSWLPRAALPFAAPSRQYRVAEAVTVPDVAPPVRAGAPAEAAPPGRPAVARPRLSVVAPRPAEAPEVPAPAPVEAPPRRSPVPRFALQLLRAGSCLLLVELPTGEPFQTRDPGYLLLKDILRAARLPDSPRQVGNGEPVRWPLLDPGALDQGEEAARDYVQGVLAAARDEEGYACLWLVGAPARRFASGEPEDGDAGGEIHIDGVGVALALPGLEAMMEDPGLKPAAWRTLRRSMPRWVEPA